MEKSNLLRLQTLQSKGYFCHMLSLNKIGNLSQLIKEANIQSDSLNYTKNKFVAFLELRKFLNTQMFDAIIVTGHNLLATLAIHSDAKPKILCVHFHHEGVKPSWQWKLFYRIAFKKYDAIFFITEYIRNEAVQIAPFIQEKAHVLYNIFPLQDQITDQEKRVSRQVFGISPKCKVVGNAGWLIERKRFDVFINVANEILRRQKENIIFLIAGDGPCKNDLEKLTVNFGIKEKVKFIGWQTDIRSFYAAVDIVLFNSDFDALGRTPLEAISFGIPFIASIVKGGLSEIIPEYCKEIIIKKHDKLKLADQVVKVLFDDNYAKYIVSQVRGQISEKCSSQKHFQILEHFLCRKK